ncbi:MAG: hypothetical protein HUU50_11120 [Candidatus Brocadiae bacterium]|nr:hypothetical protein [Candidatus Brocadiia bacterium]
MEISTIQETLNKEQGTTCPACGHFAGVYENCPRCGTYLPKRTSLKFFKYFSLVLGVGGLFFLYLWVLHRDLPKIQVKDVTETMNFAYIQMSGSVTKEPRIYTDENKKIEYLTFAFHDGTGEIRAMAYRHNAQKLVDQKKLPRKGDYVTLKGQLKVKADQNVSIMLQAVEQLTIKRAQSALVPLEKINKDYINKDVAVRGKVESIRMPREGSKQPVTIELSSEGKRLPLVMWNNVYSDIMESIAPEVGTVVYVNAFVKEHQNRIQLQLQQAQDMRLDAPQESGTKEEIQEDLPKPAEKDKKESTKKVQKSFDTQLIEISKITVQDKEKWYQVQGTIVDVKKFGSGTKVLVKEGNAKIEAVLWDKTFSGSDVIEKIKNGIKIKVTGRVDVYREKIQLHPANSEQVEITGGNASQNDFSSIDKVTKEHVDQTITLKGKVVKKTKVKPGTSLLITDNNGTIGVMLWDRIFKESKIAWEIEVGKWIQVTGSISEHKEKLQIQPNSEEDIKMIDPSGIKEEPKKPKDNTQKTKQNDPIPAPVEAKSEQAILKQFKEVVPVPEEEKNLEKAYLDFVAYTTKAHLGKIVPSSGFILEKEVLPNVGVKFVFQDRSGRIDLLLPQERFQNSPYYQFLDKGFGIWMQGKVIEYQGKLMLQPRGDADFKIESLPKKESEEPKAEPKVAQVVVEDVEDSGVKISDETVGQSVTIYGRVLHIKDIKPGKRLVVAGKFGKIDVIMLKDIFDATPLWADIKPQSYIQTTGEVKKFQERFEIKPEQKDAIKIVSTSKAKVQEEKVISVGKIADLKDHEGKKVSLTSMVVETKLIPPGFEASLKDDTGMIKLFVKESLLTDMSQWQNCVPGSKIQVTARVNKGREKTQLELQNTADFQILEKGTSNPLAKPALEDKPAQDWVEKK